jgi:predicted transcriptional regulator of viral defense system
MLLDKTKIREVRLAFPSRTETRYTLGDPQLMQLALSLRPSAYLSHMSAMHLHHLTSGPLSHIYINVEQAPKSQPDEQLTQQRLDTAFQRPARTSTQTANHEGVFITILNGKQTGQLGVAPFDVGSEALPVTAIERTLIDIAVRPQYAGGTLAVLNAYRQARDRFSTGYLIDLLDELDFVYPYHQSIGFYLDRAKACSKSDLELFLDVPQEFDFYIANQINDLKHDKRWRVFYPATFDVAVKGT